MVTLSCVPMDMCLKATHTNETSSNTDEQRLNLLNLIGVPWAQERPARKLNVICKYKALTITF